MRARRWCAWCGDDIHTYMPPKRHSPHFCGRKCEREFWHDVYQAGEDPSAAAASLASREEATA